MADTKFTPGPWRLGNFSGLNDRFIYDGSDEGWAIADTKMHHGRHHKQGLANAHLIAAAPELYEALEDAALICRAFGHQCPQFYAALAKARGEA